MVIVIAILFKNSRVPAEYYLLEWKVMRSGGAMR